ncbi:MAG: TRAP transporter small permease subunit [Kofleriaceae bacterium]
MTDGADDPDLPPTRKQTALPVEDDSGGLIETLSYPDDGPVSATARKIDDWIGKIEQAVLVVLLAAVVLTAAGHALLDRLTDVRLEFKDEVIRGGTFAIAVFGGAFASQQVKNLRMDLISRRISPARRLMVRIAIGVFVLFILGLVIRASLPIVENAETARTSYEWFTPHRVALVIPIGALLMSLHAMIHIVIDVDYLARGKTPPERMLAGH